MAGIAATLGGVAALERTANSFAITFMSTSADDAARRAYWDDQMKHGYELVQKSLTFEVRE